MPTKYKKIKLPDGSTIDEHRLVWLQHYGEIPAGMVVHHKNEKPRDNRIENLELMPLAEHSCMHIIGQAHSIEKLEFDHHYAKEWERRVVTSQGFLICKSCKQELPPEDFHKDSRMLTGRRATCKECRKVAAPFV